jgi:3-hydroxyacyl-[acyl-carrier-protein] dehydratase
MTITFTFAGEVADSLREARLDGDTLSATFCFDPGLAVFDGHFPGYPVVPGVMEVESARRAWEVAAGGRWRLTGVPKAKFKDKVLPGSTLRLEAQARERTDNRVVLAAVLEGPERRTAEITLELERA